jgi:penicillin-binding protein-related factor A (putative recombinase)
MGMKLANSRANRGRPLERLIEQSAALSRLVVLEKTAPRAVRTKNGWVNLPGPCDFDGEVIGSGVRVVLDAKETAKPQGFYLSDLPDHQRAFLVRHGSAGAVAGLLIHAKATDRLHWCSHPRLGYTEAWLTPCIPFGAMVDLGPASAGLIDFAGIPGVTKGEGAR